MTLNSSLKAQSYTFVAKKAKNTNYRWLSLENLFSALSFHEKQSKNSSAFAISKRSE